MDIKSCIALIFGISFLQTVAGYLRCIECTHISLYENNNNQFQGSQQVYDLLRPRLNPACAMNYPLDRRAYEQQVQLNQQQSPNQNVFTGRDYQVAETICPAFSDANRCNYVHGDVTVYLANYDATLNLNMHVRNCQSLPALENKCYIRDTNLGYNDIKLFIQDRLSFLSRDLTVTRFLGNQCVCNSDLCSAEISSAVRIQGFSFAFVLMLVSYYFSKLY